MVLDVITEAIVLDKEDIGEADSRVFLYTKNYGKIIAKATSSRKITSKLAAYLEPLSYINVRLVARGDGIFDLRNSQLVDALLIGESVKWAGEEEKLKNALRVSYFISRSIPKEAADADLWDFLLRVCVNKQDISLKKTLDFLGFGRNHASCEICASLVIEYFYPINNSFVCRNCVSTAPMFKKEFIKLI